jgi:hypothetical protein
LACAPRLRGGIRRDRMRGAGRGARLVGKADPDGLEGLLDGVGYVDPCGRQGDRQQEHRCGGREDRSQQAAPRARAPGEAFPARARRRDDRAHVSLRRDLVNRTDVGAANRVRQIRVELGPGVKRHARA